MEKEIIYVMSSQRCNHQVVLLLVKALKIFKLYIKKIKLIWLVLLFVQRQFCSTSYIGYEVFCEYSVLNVGYFIPPQGFIKINESLNFILFLPLTFQKLNFRLPHANIGSLEECLLSTNGVIQIESFYSQF